MVSSRALISARNLRSDYCLSQLPDLSIEDIVFDLGVAIQYRDLEGCDAALLVRRGRGIIVLSTAILEAGRKRFAIAHELGHFIMHAKKNSAYLCTEEMFLQWYKGSPEELEANTFASEFLIPSEDFVLSAMGMQLSHSTLSQIASMYKVSLTTVLIRYLESGPTPCALVAVKNGQLLWFKTSRDFRYKLRYEPKDIVSESTCAGEFFVSGAMETCEQPVLQSEWLILEDTGEVLINELPFYMPRYKTVISLLWI